jgi:hypothetical protein
VDRDVRHPFHGAAEPNASKPTIGFISTWPVYQGTTIDRYAHSLIQGISAAANEQGCNLLLGCGFSVTGNNPQNPSFWPVPGPNINFVPVGPWNTDGLIIVPDELTKEQSQYVHDLLASGFPIIFTTPEGPGPIVAVAGNGWDNTNPSAGNAWENQALFDFEGKVLPALDEYLNP